MKKQRPHTTETLAKNLNFLMREYGFSERDLEKASGVSSKTINNMRNAKHPASIENVEKVAAAFGLDGWQMIVHGLPESALVSKELSQTISNYAAADIDGRKAIARVAEREALYSKKNAS